MRTYLLLPCVAMLLLCCEAKKEIVKPESNKSLTAAQVSFADTWKSKIIEQGLDATKEWMETTITDSSYNIHPVEIKEAAYELLSTGYQTEALAVLQQNIAMHPGSQVVIDERVMYSVADQLVDANMPELAIAYLRLNIKVFPESEKVYRSLGDILMRNNQTGEALSLYQKSIEIDSSYTLSNISLRPPKAYIPTALPVDTTALYTSAGNLENDTAFIYVQGGPMLQLNKREWQDPFFLMPNTERMLRIYIYQSQMLNPHVVGPGHLLTEEQAHHERSITVEAIHRTVSYMKDRGKTVFLIGHSFGGGLCQAYLHTRENRADRIILMGTDLNRDPRCMTMRSRGNFIRWKNGTEPYATKFFRHIPEDFPYKEQQFDVLENLGKLVDDHGKKRYTNLLKDIDLEGVSYVHARFDEATGRIDLNTIEFLQSKDVETIELYGDHHSMYSKQFMTSLYHNLIEGSSIKKSIACALAKRIEERGLEEGLKLFEKIKSSSAYFSLSEDEMNLLGYEFLQSNRNKEAIAIFKLNVENFPLSWNVYDSLGEAYRADGQTELSIANYKKSLELNPQNTYASDALEELNSK